MSEKPKLGVLITSDRVVVPIRHAVKVQGTLYGKTFEVNKDKQYFRFTSDYEESKIIHFNEVNDFSVTHDPKKYLCLIALLTLVLFVGIFIILYKILMPKYQVEFEMKNKEDIRFRLHLDKQTASAMEKVFQSE